MPPDGCEKGKRVLMSAERPARRTPRKHSSGRSGNAVPMPEQELLAPERQYVDIDPWAMLLEQLMEVPEEEPAQRKPEGGK
jgi:hypothetical protein